jgi:hypothetical protein
VTTIWGNKFVDGKDHQQPAASLMPNPKYVMSFVPNDFSFKISA